MGGGDGGGVGGGGDCGCGCARIKHGSKDGNKTAIGPDANIAG